MSEDISVRFFMVLQEEPLDALPTGGTNNCGEMMQWW